MTKILVGWSLRRDTPRVGFIQCLFYVFLRRLRTSLFAMVRRRERPKKSMKTSRNALRPKKSMKTCKRATMNKQEDLEDVATRARRLSRFKEGSTEAWRDDEPSSARHLHEL